MTFNMTSRDNQTVTYGHPPDGLELQLLPDPEFWFHDEHMEQDCFHVSPDEKQLKIKGKNIPDKSWIQVRVHSKNCPVLGATDASLTCDLTQIITALEAAKGGQKNPSEDSASDLKNSSDPEALSDRSRSRRRRAHFEEKKQLAEGTYKLTVVIRRRRFFSACLDISRAVPGIPENTRTILSYALGVVGAVLAVLLLVVSCRHCVRRAKRRQFQKRRCNEQYSAASGNVLIPSPIGSAENTYVSLAHLLNPNRDRKRKQDIHEKGLLIQRKYLTLGNVIGHGNFGCVFEGYLQRRSGDATEDDLPQKVAVKTLLDPATHAIDLQSFINEALLMKDLDHAHVLGLLGLSEGDRGLPLVIIPFMPRGDLLTFVKDENNTEMTVGDVFRFCVDIASGMEYLANEKLVHRDLAARNCMLDEDLRVKVADFGLCRDVYEKGYYHSDNKKKLPIRWMAIESIEKGTYSLKSDVWSMAVVIWELTTRGITPYPGVEGWDILRYLLAGRRLDQPLLCPDPLYALMERCWDEKPIKRPPFQELRGNLERMAEALQTPATANALCLDTKITMPRCHRFRDDAAVMEKVLMGMHKRSRLTITKSRELHAPASPKGRNSVRKSDAPAQAPASPAADGTSSNVAVTQESQLMLPVPETSGCASSAAAESLEMQELKRSGKDDGYFVLEK